MRMGSKFSPSRRKLGSGTVSVAANRVAVKSKVIIACSLIWFLLVALLVLVPLRVWHSATPDMLVLVAIAVAGATEETGTKRDSLASV